MLSSIAEIIRDLLIFVIIMAALLITLVVVISMMPDSNPLKRLLTALSYRVGATLAAGASQSRWSPSPVSHLIDKGIRVNAVAPGPVWTPLNPADRDRKGITRFGSDTPMGRPAQPEEIAPAFVFLAAPSCSSYITGEILPIIGGYSGG
jgi:hypothetical protein